MLGSDEVDKCRPIKTLDGVLKWSSNPADWSTMVTALQPRSDYCYQANQFTCHKNARKPGKLLRSSVPKTLVCHDMKGGYLDDKYAHGTAYSYQYLFYHWSVIDTFVYFSHHLVTIPPLMWINAAHTHGVPILGTVISEGKDGCAVWNCVLRDDHILDAFVDKLAEICQHYKFDGYLMNIENEIEPELLPKLIVFLRNLKTKLAQFDGTVIWYDSVSLISGRLKWQNELNSKNKIAFDICDGIFLNYSWKNINLLNSLTNAGARQTDVYVGIDVFGREFFGGGGFNTDKALSVVRSFGLSIAIFGQGWTHETQASNFQFFYVERKFWASIWQYLYIHLPNTTPLVTTFNQGICNKDGEDRLWYDLSSQSYQLSIPSCPNLEEDKCCISHSRDDYYSGGSCILLNKNENEFEIHRLLLCDFPCKLASRLCLRIAAKGVNNSTPFHLILTVENGNRNHTVILPVSDNTNPIADDGEFDYSCDLAMSNRFNETKTYEKTSNDWIINEFCLDFDGSIVEINVKIKESVMIGYLALTNDS